MQRFSFLLAATLLLATLAAMATLQAAEQTWIAEISDSDIEAGLRG